MKQINPAYSSVFFKKIIFLTFCLPVFHFAHSQCLTPFPTGDIDSTLRNVAVSTIVTQNDYTSSSSGVIESGDSLSITQSPGHGTAVALNDSTILYTPAQGFVGTDIYFYDICNACGNCGQSSVSIEVRAYCPAPVPVADYDTVFNNVPNSLNVTANDQNTAGGPLTVAIFHQPEHGTASASGADIIYTSAAGYTGADTLVYLVSDTCSGTTAVSAYVYLTVVTCRPVVAVNDTFAVQQQSAVSKNLAANDINATGFGTPTVTLLNSPKYGGTATVSGTIITYTGGSAGVGKDSILYQICTACGCDTAYAIATVTPKPCSRPAAMPDTGYAGYSVNCVNVFNVLANDSLPINGGTVTVTVAKAPLYGTATVANNIVHYTNTDSAAGQTDSLLYALCNSCYCDTGVLHINITHYACNGLNPVVYGDTVHVCRNFPVTMYVLGHDYSPGGFVVSVHSIATQPAHGTAAVASDSSVVYTPGANYTGMDQFVFSVCDNGTPQLCTNATATVYIDSCHLAPIVLNAAGNATDTVDVAVMEDGSLTYCFHVTQADSPYVYIAGVINASTDTVIPFAGSIVPGTSPLCVQVTDAYNNRSTQTVAFVICNEYPICDTITMSVAIDAVNHPPVAQNDTLSYIWPGCTGINVIDGDADIDTGDHITISSFSATTANGTVTQDGDSVLCYLADSSFAGIDTFYYVVCDTSHACDTGYVAVTVPLLARSDNAMTMQDSTLYIPVTNNDTKTANEYITLCAQPLHGTVVVDSTVIQYTPNQNFPVNSLANDTTSLPGIDSFCYTLCGVVGTDTECSSAEVYITVTPKYFYIPQGISPNGDGVNDVFTITLASEFPYSQLLVYNRYGDEVWRNDGDGYANDFDGTWKKNGQPLPDGSYWYIFKFNDGVTQDRMGYIVIQR
jgi:gliding motility-associated-like protein